MTTRDYKEYPIDVVRFLARERKEKGLTQADVAAIMYCSVNRVHQIERLGCSLPVLDRYASALGYDLILRLVEK